MSNRVRNPASSFLCGCNTWGIHVAALSLRTTLWCPGKVPYFHGCMDCLEFLLGGLGAYTCGLKSGGGLFQISLSFGRGLRRKLSLLDFRRSWAASKAVCVSNPNGFILREPRDLEEARLWVGRVPLWHVMARDISCGCWLWNTELLVWQVMGRDTTSCAAVAELRLLQVFLEMTPWLLGTSFGVRSSTELPSSILMADAICAVLLVACMEKRFGQYHNNQILYLYWDTYPYALYGSKKIQPNIKTYTVSSNSSVWMQISKEWSYNIYLSGTRVHKDTCAGKLAIDFINRKVLNTLQTVRA